MYWAETSLTFVLAISVMAFKDWRLMLLAVLPAPLVSVAVMLFGRAIHERFEAIQAMFSDISSRVQENLSGVRMVRAFVQEAAELRRFEKLNQDYIRQNLRLVRISGLFQPLLEGLIGVTFLVVLWAGGYQVLHNRISMGGFIMFNTYMGMLVWPMIALGWVVNLMQRGTASMSRINQIMHETPTIAAPPSPVPIPQCARRNRVSRRYPGLSERPRTGARRSADSRPAPRSPWWATPEAARARSSVWCPA